MVETGVDNAEVVVRLWSWYTERGVLGVMKVVVENEGSCDWSSVLTVRLFVVVERLAVFPGRGSSRNEVGITGTGGGLTGGASTNGGLGGL